MNHCEPLHSFQIQLINYFFVFQSIELATEAIPGCVLQIFVVLTNANNMGIGAVISIAISALATGFTSAKIAFDKDLDTQGRKNQPKFYGEFCLVLR